VAECLKLVMLLVTVLVLPGLVVGLVVSLFQAATQINEQTLSFLPRLLVTLLAVAWRALDGGHADGLLRQHLPARRRPGGLSRAPMEPLLLLLALLTALWWPFCRSLAVLSMAPVLGEAWCR
jgi:hypothetical protein